MAKKREPDRLDIESSAAIAAGMSYGKWKAMQGEVEIEKPPLPSDWRVCAWCGTPLKLKNKRPKLYCEVYCQRLASGARQDERRRQKAKEVTA
jgi:hypothetical protein